MCPQGWWDYFTYNQDRASSVGAAGLRGMWGFRHCGKIFYSGIQSEKCSGPKWINSSLLLPLLDTRVLRSELQLHKFSNVEITKPRTAWSPWVMAQVFHVEGNA